jgi:hypothetical protein
MTNYQKFRKKSQQKPGDHHPELILTVNFANWAKENNVDLQGDIFAPDCKFNFDKVPTKHLSKNEKLNRLFQVEEAKIV